MAFPLDGAGDGGQVEQTDGGDLRGSGDGGQSIGGQAPVELSDDALVKAPGFDKPVRFGDIPKRFQADYTRKTQEHAKQVQQWEAQKRAWEQTRGQEENRLRELATALLQRQNQGQPQGQTFADRLKAKTYLDGETAAALFQEIQDNGFGQVSQEIAKRDQVIQALYQQVMNLQKGFTSLQGQRSSQEFDGKINKWLTEGGYPPEAADLAKEIYLAYEGEDLDNEFPTIFQNRWNQIQTLVNAANKKRVDAAKQNPFKLPGKGGQGSAGKPAGLKGHESPKEVSDFLWEFINAKDDAS